MKEEFPDRRCTDRDKTVKETLKMSESLKKDVLEYAEENEIYYAGELNFSGAARELLEQALDEKEG